MFTKVETEAQRVGHFLEFTQMTVDIKTFSFLPV